MNKDNSKKVADITDALARKKAGSVLSDTGPVDSSPDRKPGGQARQDNRYIPPPPKRQFTIKRRPIPRSKLNEGILELLPVTSKTSFCDFVLLAGLPWPIYPNHDTEIFDLVQGTFERRKAEASKG